MIRGAANQGIKLAAATVTIAAGAVTFFNDYGKYNYPLMYKNHTLKCVQAARVDLNMQPDETIWAKYDTEVRKPNTNVQRTYYDFKTRVDEIGCFGECADAMVELSKRMCIGHATEELMEEIGLTMITTSDDPQRMLKMFRESLNIKDLGVQHLTYKMDRSPVFSDKPNLYIVSGDESCSCWVCT